MDYRLQILEKAEHGSFQKGENISENATMSMCMENNKGDYGAYLSLCSQCLVAMNISKETTMSVPSYTRFRMIKRIIRKFVKYATKNQRNFNFAAYSMLETGHSIISDLVERLNVLEEENKAIKIKLYGEETLCEDKNVEDKPRTRTDEKKEDKLKIQIQGPFETTYSLALVNKNLAEALEMGGYADTSICAMDGAGAYKPEETNLIDKPLAKILYEKGVNEKQPSITISNNYPPIQPYLTGELNFQYFAWEEDRVPRKYVQWFNNNLDGVGTSSHFVTKALIDSGLTIPVRTIGNGVKLDAGFERILPYPLKTTKKTRFLHISSAFPRKGIDVLLNGYFKAFTSEDDVCLVLKTFDNPHNNTGEILAKLQKLYPNGPEVEWINMDLSEKSLMGLYKAADCYVQVARGEGFGLPVAEAMLAKIPVIVSNNSGLADFCNEKTCVTISYKMTKAFAHVSEENSQWAEPNEEELTQRLRDFVYNKNPLLLNEKIEAAYKLISEEYSWDAIARKWMAFIDDIMKNQDKPSVDMITTWNTKCGIAEFTRFLIEKAQRRVSFSIYPDITYDLVKSDEPFVKERVWMQSSDDANIEELAKKLNESLAETVHVQYTQGFFNLFDLAKLIEQVKNKKIIIEFHNTKSISGASADEKKKAINALNSVHKIIVHQSEDIKNLTGEGVNENLIQVILHGQLVFPERDKDEVRKQLGINASYVVGSYGFLFPHKGIKKTINAIKILKQKYPDILYLAVCSKFDSSDSEQYYNECMEEIEKNGLKDNVLMFPEFLPVEVSSTLLQACDVIVMAYDKTNESASGAARFCISVNRPFITTKQNIFKEFSDCSYQIKDNSPQLIAEAISSLMHTPDRYKKQILQKIAETNWKTTSDKYIEIYKS